MDWKNNLRFLSSTSTMQPTNKSNSQDAATIDMLLLHSQGYRAVPTSRSLCVHTDKWPTKNISSQSLSPGFLVKILEEALLITEQKIEDTP